MFTEKFGNYVCEGDTITATKNGLTYTAKIKRDETYGIDDDDSHNIDQKVTGCNSRQQKKLLAARKAWFNDEWFFCGIVISVYTELGVLLDDHAASLWGMEANYPTGKKNPNSYLTDTANDLFNEAEESATAKIKEWEQFAADYLS